MIQQDTDRIEVQRILEEKKAELIRTLQRRDGIEIQRSGDQMDEIQFGQERDLAIRSVDRESTMLRNVNGALLRIADGSFGICIDCEEAISPKRLQAVPWASRCIRCQEVDDRNGQERMDDTGDSLGDAA